METQREDRHTMQVRKEFMMEILIPSRHDGENSVFFTCDSWAAVSHTAHRRLNASAGRPEGPSVALLFGRGYPLQRSVHMCERR